MMDLRDDLRHELHSLGFQAVGFTRPTPPPHLATYQAWIEAGRHGEMAYLASARGMERRANPQLILPGAGLVLVAALPYDPPERAPQRTSAPVGQIAAYALGADYHDVIPPRLQQAASKLEALRGSALSRRAYADTGPILEHDFAQQAGLGWIGKHTCLIIPRRGSYFLLGELFLNLDLEPDPPFSADQCGSCTRCIDACPTDCILPDRTVDARRCISYQTIENKGTIPPGLRPLMGNWIFGCDVCQEVCPWNIRFAGQPGDPMLAPRPRLVSPDLFRELSLNPAAFSDRFKGSPVKRSKRRGYLRNVAVALGNSLDPTAADPLSQCLEAEPEALVRAHAAWALGRLNTPRARAALEKALRREADPAVGEEISAALA